MLTPLGFETWQADSGPSALSRLRSERPDLVIVDLRMDEMDGLQFSRQARREFGPSVKIVLMSASVLAFDPQIAFDAGCDGFLPKPFREAELLARLQSALNLRWVFEPIVQSPPATTPAEPLPPSTTESVLTDLRDCARRGDIRGLRQQLALIPDDESPLSTLAHELRPLIQSYRMDAIRHRLDRPDTSDTTPD